jgi:hypothetical protein
MIINDKDALKRLNSPMNLINRLAETSKSNSRKSAMSLFIKPKEEIRKIETFNPFEPHAIPTTPTIVSDAPILEQIVENHESQIKLGLAHDKALDLLNRSVEILSAKLDDVKADKLPATIMAASKVVESIRKERNEATRNNKDREVHYHFYTPQQKLITDFEVIEVQ